MIVKDKVINLILEFAESDESVRVVMMNGSRVNSNAPKDIMQDYDVVFFIDNLEELKFKKNREWISRFGKPVIVQQNDFEDGSYIFLMQFDDFRIDLSFSSVLDIKEKGKEDSLSLWLLDKDDIAPEIPEPNDSTYVIKQPDEKTFDMMLNEAWWLQPYIAKGIWRDELPYVRNAYDKYFMDSIKSLVSWDIGMTNNWSVNTGTAGKWFKNFMDEEEYKEFSELYSSNDYEEIWEKLFLAGKFIRKIGTRVADKLGYEYPMEYDVNVTEYLKKIKDNGECRM
ncbi:aminoglycoside 6-adenylyltransferase [Oceanirhabdus sp. W0125-5]|uniref:aminoglycoside 6-adenylyltransferase n=1 Tax=Oceanirhabdus sp. W0125-5 TaxID=2999116 RepID=UPI0022F2D46F|nr:aminoglycoside 6-adenylyltransferase [Oceanirhabdus sp. W0125-5]WBW95804.1 aminoglycoside 6-adenylyltransferase [Oceanirhabdus sp. W0125-5]